MSKTEKKYSEAIAEIEAIIANIEQGAVSIDDLTAHIKTATGLLQFCKLKLTEIDGELVEK